MTPTVEGLERRVMLSAALLSDVYPGANGSGAWGAVVGGTLFFTANDGINGAELWKTDGTPGGTALVQDIYSGASGSGPAYFTEANGVSYFTARDVTSGIELWRSDGTAAGTRQVKDIYAGTFTSSPYQLTNVNGTLFFSATNGGTGSELWKSDGTESGTLQVKDINTGSVASSPGSLTNVNGTLFFAAKTATSGIELWKSDGTAGGTLQVKDITSGTGNSSPTLLTNVNGTLFFVANDVTNGAELWKSDGTAAGTVIVKDIASGSTGSSPTSLTNVNGTLYFAATTSAGGTELWRSDGTPAGTVQVKDIVSGVGNSSPSNLLAVNGKLFFAATDGTRGNELWSSDGTAAGTVLVKDINSGAGSSTPTGLTNVNGRVFFAAADGSHGIELWSSDGTGSGTLVVKDINPGASNASPGSLVNFNGRLWFVASDGAHGAEPWIVAPPVAVAGGPYAVNEGGSTTLDASGSSDPGETLTYLWDFDGDGIYGETGSAALHGDEVGLNPIFRAAGMDGPASCTISLRVTDSAGLSSTTSAPVNILNTPPTLTLSGAASVNEAATYVLSLSSSDPGTDTITSWRITWGDGAVDTITGNPSSATHIYTDAPNNYTINATATDEDGTYAAGNTVAVTVNMLAPANLIASATSSTQIDLTWSDDSGNETGVVIESSTDGVSFSPIATVAANSTACSATGLAALTLYYFRVRATAAGGAFSAYSNTASATTLIAPPDAPSDLLAMAYSVSRIDLTWTDNASTETRFVLQQSTDGSTWSQVATLAANLTSYNVTGLAMGVTYTFRLCASNAGGNSAWSNSSSAMTYSMYAPNNPTATALSASQIQVTWTDRADNESGYAIEQSTNGITFSQIATVAANTISYTATDLNSTTTYSYRVRGWTGLGYSAYSGSVSATTLALPAVPSNLAASTYSVSRIDLSWNDNASDESGFTLQQSIDGSAWSEVATLAADLTSYSVTGLAMGVTYSFRICSFSAGGDSGWSNTATAMTYPMYAPGTPAATALSNTQIQVTWVDRADNESGYAIEQSADATTFSQTATVAANTTTYTVSGLNAGTTYYYRIRGWTALGSSAYSAVVSARTLTIPAAPSNLAATAYSVSRVDLSWQDNAANESGFTLQHSIDGTTWSQVATLAANVTSYSVTGLAMGVTYSFRISTYNADGNSSWSNIPSAMTYPLYAPNSPVATALSVSQIQLTWVDRADNELGYAIEHSTNGTTFSQVATVAANTTTYTASGLSAGTKYYYRVRGWAGLGYSGYSATASATTLVFVPAPSNLQAAALSESQLRLTWIDNAGNEGGFKIERSTDGGTTFSQIATTAANLTSYNVTGLSVNTSYTFRVRAYGAGADSAYSNTASATTLTISAPSNLAATAVSSTRVNLTWSDNSGSEQGFFIDWSTDQVTWVRTVQMVPNLTTYGITILSPGTSYYFRVQANASSGNSTYSNVANATTYAVNAPTGLAVSVVSANQINLTWRDNANNESAYSIERSTNGTTFAVIGTVAVNLTTYSSTGLAVGVLYYYRVRATTTGGGFSAYSNTVSARTSAATPNAPSNLQATGTSETQISLSWTDNASNEAGFKIERSTDGGTTFVQVATLPANTTSYNVTGLSANTGYMFRVRAYAAGGDSAYSNTATGATPVANAPTNAAASVVSSSQVKVTWTDNSSTEVGFFIDRSVDQVTWMRTVQMTPNLTMYTVTGLATNTTYYFRVQALAGGGPSPYSNIASARTPIAGAVPGGSASPSSLASQTLASGTSPSLLSQADQGQLLM